MRKISSYAKVRHLIGNLIRNRKFQIPRAMRLGKRFLDLGCGPNIHGHVLNLDYLWCPGVDICWDVTRGIPLPDSSMEGVFSEHCLEHFSLPQGLRLLREIHRVLQRGAIIRIVVPDAGLYLEVYARRMTEDGTSFPFESQEGFEGSFILVLSVNWVFYQDRESLVGHRIMYDEALLKLVLEKAGFHGVCKRAFMHGTSPELLLDAPSRECESLYMEGTRH